MKKGKTVLNCLFLNIIITMIPVILLQTLNISGTFYDILNAISYFISILLLLFVTRGIHSKNINKNFLLLVILIISMLLSQIFSYFKFGYIMSGDIIAMISIFINIYVYVFALTRFDFTEDDFISFMKKIVFLGLISCFYNIIINGSNFFHIFGLSSSYLVSFSSFFRNRNQFGIFLLICILSFLYCHKAYKSKHRIIIFLLLSSNLIFTMSRNSLLGFSIILLFLVLNSINVKKMIIRKKHLLLFACLLFCIMLFAIYSVNNSFIIDSINRLFLRAGSSNLDSGRFDAWRHALTISLNNPLLGVGRFMALDINKKVFFSTLGHFHSNYVELFVSYGFVGIAFYLALILKLFKQIHSINDIWLKKICILCLIVFLSVSLFETICRFSIGYIDTLTLIYFFTIPIMLSNSTNKKSWSD